jgi:hypothetical protein
MIQWLLSLFRTPTPEDDIYHTKLTTWKHLLRASKDPELLTRSLAMSSQLASCGAALREVHGIAFAENSVAMRYMKAVANGNLADIEAFDGLLMKGLGFSDVRSDEQKVWWISNMLSSTDNSHSHRRMP